MGTTLAAAAPFLCVLALACSGVACLIAYRKTPQQAARQALGRIADVVDAWNRERELFEATRARWVEQFEAIAERCDETLERAESKRRRVAAAESRARGNNTQTHEPTRQEIVDHYRRLRAGIS